MAFTWIVSRIIRLFGQKTNALFYLLTYRELQAEIVELAGKLGVSPVDLSKEIGRRAARESAQRHASVLGIVPINPNSPEQIKKYIEVLWFVLFGKEMRDYTVRVDDETPGHQRLTFLLEHCPVCMGHEEDAEAYQELYKSFSGKAEGYACLMAGMLEDLARIIMENKGMDIRIVIRETQCYARGDDVMAVEAQVMPVKDYEELKQAARVETGLATPISIEQGGEFGAVAGGGLEGIGQQSARLFSKVYESLQLEKLDSFFEAPSDKIKDKLSETVEQQLHFKPKEILEYFQNYEPDIFRVLGYLGVHALNEAGGIVEKLVGGNSLMNKLVDILISALEYGLETYIPERLVQDNKRMIMEFVQGWAPESSVEKINEMDSKVIFKLVLEGVKLALADFGAEFVGAKEATWTILKKTSILQNEGDTPSEDFSIIFDIFQEAALVAGYLMALPVKALVSTEYEAAKTPLDSAQDIYHASREHLEKLFDLIERFQEMDRSTAQERRIGEDMRKAFPRVF